MMKGRIFASVVVGCCALSVFLGIGGAAADVATGKGAAALENQTRSLAELAMRYQGVRASRQQALREQLLRLARERQQLLARAVEEDPGAVLRVALPAVLREGLPPAVQNYIERQAEIEGTLEVLYEDFPDHAVLRHFLHSEKERFALHFKVVPPGLQSGARVRARGLLVGDVLALESGETELLVLAAGGDGSSETATGGSSPPLSQTLGEQGTLLLLVNFQDQPTEPLTVNDADHLVFGTTSDFMRENSYGQTWLSGQTFGWFTLPINATCSGPDIASAADAAAAAAGMDLSAYSRHVYFFPRNSACGWDGQGTVGGAPSKSWINGRFETKFVAHELGHNFGLYHSHALECGAETQGESCQSLEYGDTLDAMGNRVAGHLNAFQKSRLGWLGYNLSPPVTTVESGGSHAVALQELPGQEAKALKVLRSQDPATGQKSWLYVEYRQDVGFDAFLAGNANVLGGVVIHAATDGDANSSQLLDLTPASSPYGYYDWDDPALIVGSSFTDPVSGVTIHPVWADGAAATVEVGFGQPACVRAAPTLTLTPGQGPWVAPGTAVEFSVTVTSADSAACSSATFDLSSSLPSGWSAFSSPAALTLAPGASSTAALTVTSAADAADGFYDFAAVAGNRAEAALSGSAVATYVVSGGSANLPPLAANDAAATSERTAVTIAVLANDSDPDGDPLAVAGVAQGAGGTVTVNSDGTVTYAPKGRFKGTDVFTYTVSDGVASATAQVAVTVAGSGGGTGGGGKGKK